MILESWNNDLSESVVDDKPPHFESVFLNSGNRFDYHQFHLRDEACGCKEKPSRPLMKLVALPI